MNSSWLKKALPHLIAIAIFAITAIVFCKPALEGKQLYQSDIVGYKAMAQQSVEFKEKYGHYPLWTESMFSGMPAYNIDMDATSHISIFPVYYLLTLGLPKPISYFFLACICFYILTQVFRISPWLGVLSALAYSYSTYDPVIIVVGHETKMLAIAYAPAVIAGLLLIFQRKYLAGSAVLALFMGLQASTQHLQIIYYTGIFMGLISICYLIESWKQKQIRSSLIGIAFAVIAGVVGFSTYAVTMLPTKEYATETMRGGKSELSGDANNKTKGGLDKDYAFGWSYGVGETFTLIVPGMYGGGSSGRLFTENSKFADKLMELGVPEVSALQSVNGYSYWGPQPFTAGPVYLGAITCFLFILGLVYVKGWHKWWLITATIIGILLAWGKNFSTFNYFLFDHLPYYNKFRAPSIALFIPQLTFPLLGALGLQQIIFGGESSEFLWKKFRTSIFITAGALVILIAFYFMADFKGENDARIKERYSSALLQQISRGKQPSPEMQQQSNEIVNSLMKGLQSDRQSLSGSDLLRSILFIAVAIILTGLFLKRKIKPVVLIAALIILSSYDLLAEGRKYLNEDNFVEPTDLEAEFKPSSADEQIKKDPEKNFRVFDQTIADPFQDSHASYFHNSIGGYHPAKLGLYQDIIANQLTKGNMHVIDMLNTKYFIRRNAAGTDDEAILNPDAYGPCWLVKGIRYVTNADEEMKALDYTNLKDTAIVRKSYQGSIRFMPVWDSAASVKLIENLNDKISYQFSAKSNQFAVFSEVYYDKGWDAYLDGNKADYVKVNYILRGMAVPAGEHKIEFRFEPHSYKLGNVISLWACLITYLMIFLAGVISWRKKELV